MDQHLSCVALTTEETVRNKLPIICFIYCFLALICNGCNLIECGQKVTKKRASPDNSKEIVYVSRNCGATTIPVTSAYILPKKAARILDKNNLKIKKKYKVFSYERGKTKINWVSNSELQVLYDFTPINKRTGQFLYKKKNRLGVKVSYINARRE